jgi:predicted Zn-dependent protease
LSGEKSDFVRLNQGQIRQPGHVRQYGFTVDLISGNKHAKATIRLSEDRETDQARLNNVLKDLREKLPFLPEDPHLLYAEDVQSTENEQPSDLPSAHEAVDDILSLGSDTDIVGIYAQGQLHRGFANSLGQRNWFSSANFNFDWSLYSHGDKAVKCSYAGLSWDKAILARKLEEGKSLLPVIGKEAKSIEPGKYRVYLAPAALHQIIELLCWGGFSRKAQETKQSPLLKLMDGLESLSPAINIIENTKEGIGPGFESSGFIKKPEVCLVKEGQFVSALSSPRSFREYGGNNDGANSSESPEAIEVKAGKLPSTSVLEQLGTGLYVSNLWYLNYSDATSCRMTGMTRFATLWVEDGKIVAPLNVMRFDESIYRALGSNLLGLTDEQEFVFDPGTYFERSCASAKLPGALIDDFCFTL